MSGARCLTSNKLFDFAVDLDHNSHPAILMEFLQLWNRANSKNFAVSVALAEVCTLVSVLVMHSCFLRILHSLFCSFIIQYSSISVNTYTEYVEMQINKHLDIWSRKKVSCLFLTVILKVTALVL